MGHSLGRRRRLSFARKFITDLMYFSKSIPLIVIQRRICVATLAAAREAHPLQPAWSAIFAKGFALVARENAVLRTTYISAPIPHMFEYDELVVSIAHEIELAADTVVLPVRIRKPDSLPLIHFRSKIDELSDPELWHKGGYRAIAIITALPLLLRRMIWWLALNIPELRRRFVGTFAITSVGALGAELVTPIGPFTSLLTYGPFDHEHCLNLRLVFDHRVYDGATAARLLDRLEQILRGPIEHELRSRCV